MSFISNCYLSYYFIVLRRLLVPVMSKARHWTKLLPSYEVDASGITFILTDKDLFILTENSLFSRFHEIDELKLLSYQTKSYMKYEFSPPI